MTPPPTSAAPSAGSSSSSSLYHATAAVTPSTLSSQSHQPLVIYAQQQQQQQQQPIQMQMQNQGQHQPPPPPTVADWLELERTREALQLATALDELSLNDPKKFSVPPPGYVCKLCMVKGHWLKNCNLYQERRRENIKTFGPLAIKPQLASRLMATQQLALPGRTSVPPEGYICRKCHVSGHWIQQCPYPKQTNAPPETYVCKICLVPGHWIYQCPSRIPKHQLYAFSWDHHGLWELAVGQRGLKRISCLSALLRVPPLFLLKPTPINLKRSSFLFFFR